VTELARLGLVTVALTVAVVAPLIFNEPTRQGQHSPPGVSA
jgi:hypothetical protein